MLVNVEDLKNRLSGKYVIVKKSCSGAIYMGRLFFRKTRPLLTNIMICGKKFGFVNPPFSKKDRNRFLDLNKCEWVKEIPEFVFKNFFMDKYLTLSEDGSVVIPETDFYKKVLILSEYKFFK